MNKEFPTGMRPSAQRLAVVWRSLAAAMLVIASNSVCTSQQQPQQVLVDAKTFHDMLARLDQLEARVKELESEKTRPAANVVPSGGSERVHGPMPAPESATFPRGGDTPEAKQTQTASAGTSIPEQDGMDSQMERMDVSRTLLRIRGFGDVALHGDTQKGDTTSFTLGQLDLFVTSDISDRFKFLSEIVFEGGPDTIYGVQTGQPNTFSVDLERYLIQYSQSDYFNLAVGRGHTAIGYYNTAYHHSSWLQTTTGRPFLFQFEDRGGILPVHMVGASASGQIPSGSLGLHYIAEIGNGRASRNPLQEEPVQNVVDDESHKAFNFALLSRPDAIRGLQCGVSFYRDVLAPQSQPRVGESIISAHAVLVRPRYEWLNEALLDRHAVQGTSDVYNTPGFYTQVSRQFGSYRPYFRYQYVNVPASDPIFPDVGLQHGPSLGVRYDAAESVAVKLEYDYTMLRQQPSVNGVTMQLGYTF